MDKQSARILGMQRRAGINAELKAAYDRSLFEKMKDASRSAALVGCYVSMKQEADTKAFLSWCFEHHILVAVPKTEEGTISFFRITSFEDLAPGNFAVEEPVKGTPVSVNEIDLMFVPLSSFDQERHRTGYGRGYYDSVLSPEMRKVGIAYPEQEVPFIEADPWDVTLDEIILPDVHKNRNSDV